MTLDHTDLRAKAMAATPDWNCCVTQAEDEEDGCWTSGPICDTEDQARKDNDYSTAANPTAILELLDRLERAEAELATARKKALEEAAQCIEGTTGTGDDTKARAALILVAHLVRALAAKGRG